MFAIPACNVNLKNGDVPTKSVANHSQLELIPNKSLDTGISSYGQRRKLSNLHIHKYS